MSLSNEHVTESLSHSQLRPGAGHLGWGGDSPRGKGREVCRPKTCLPFKTQAEMERNVKLGTAQAAISKTLLEM